MIMADFGDDVNANGSPSVDPQMLGDGGLKEQQKQAERIARQLLNQQPNIKRERVGQPAFAGFDGMMVNPRMPTGMYQAQQRGYMPVVPKAYADGGGIRLPTLQGAMPQELPAALSGDIMRTEVVAPSAGNMVAGVGQASEEYLMQAAKPSSIKTVDRDIAAAYETKKAARSSRFRGVTRHRRSGRWEAHIWVKATSKQVYLGGYELEEHAAEAYDVAAIKCKGNKVKTNFPIDKYRELMRFMDTISLEELVMAVRRQSQGFARGSSGYRGVTHHPNGRWEARIGMPGSKHIYLGLYNEEQTAAQAYDRALVKLRGPTAATNFALSEYKQELQDYYDRLELEKEGHVDVAAMLKADCKRTSHPAQVAAARRAAAEDNPQPKDSSPIRSPAPTTMHAFNSAEGLEGLHPRSD